MDLWMLTWKNGDSKMIMATSCDAAINIANKGWSATIDRVDINSLLYKLLETIRTASESINSIIQLLGMDKTYKF
jgi:hypothetical protein